MGALTHPLTFGDTMAMFGSDWFENSEDEDEGYGLPKPQRRQE